MSRYQFSNLTSSIHSATVRRIVTRRPPVQAAGSHCSLKLATAILPVEHPMLMSIGFAEEGFLAATPLSSALLAQCMGLLYIYLGMDSSRKEVYTERQTEKTRGLEVQYWHLR